MADVFVALLPACIYGIYNFGARAAAILLISTVSAVVIEALYQKLMGLKVTVTDGSAAVTGLLLGMNLSHTVPLWMPVLGAAFAIIVVKQLFGGLGQNFMNPALGARCFLMISFTGQMTSFTYDGVTGATPLYLVKTGELANVSIKDMFWGSIAGTIGETSAFWLLVGAVYLLVRGVISLRIPATYIITVVIMVVLFGGYGIDFTYIAAHVFGGGLVLGAFFMATDYVSSPITVKGQYVYAVLLGILTGVFRLFGGTAEGVSYSIIIGNLLVPLIERVTMPTPFGMGGKKHE
jgi:RnfABCDGE-type electron transport complex D subunit